MADWPELSLPQIARYVDTSVYEHVTTFHARTVYANMPGLAGRCYLSAAAPDELNQFEFKEASVWPGMGRSLPIPDSGLPEIPDSVRRNPSAASFSLQPLPFSIIAHLLINSFCANSPDSRRRPYPSGGALYPIHVVLCRISEVTAWPSEVDALHLLPVSRQLEDLKAESADKLLRTLTGGQTETLGTPAFAIVYAISFEQAIFKYRSRGYRLALMEAGSMYQTADLCGKALGLQNRMWAGFCDHRVARDLGLDPRHIAPLAVQFFGLAGNR